MKRGTKHLQISCVHVFTYIHSNTSRSSTVLLLLSVDRNVKLPSPDRANVANAMC